MRSYYEGKVVFVTGASAGIGEALAREAVAAGARVVLTARRVDRLEALARELGSGALAVRCDVTVDGDLERAIDAAHGFGPVDVLLANAGFGVGGPLERLTVADYQRQFDTNVLGVLRSIYAALADLRQTRGSIGIVGSANGYISLPGWSAYCMSKHAVRSLAESLGPELSSQGIRVTHLAPGFVATEFRRVDRGGALRMERQDPIPGWLQMPADRAARKMLRAVARGRRERVVTGHAQLGVLLSRHVPGLVATGARWASPWLRRVSDR
jgi:NADP-dependent 3-hydroxy acid dehydrogenase YdfG